MAEPIDKITCLLPTGKGRVRNQLEMLAWVNGIGFEAFQTIEELAEFVREAPEVKSKSLLFLHSQFAEEDGFSQQCGSFQQTVFLSEEPISKISADLSLLKGLVSIVHYDGAEIDGRDIAVLIKKTLKNDILGLDKYLGFGADRRSYTVDSDVKKEAVLEELVTYIESMNKASSLRKYSQFTSELADELVMNAVFNANPRLKEAKRDLPFQLEDKEKVEISWGFDGEYFGVSVVDPFGRLHKDTVLYYINDKTRKLDDVNLRKSGGIGLRMSVDRLHKMVFNIHENKFTEVICLIRFERKLVDFRKIPKSLHFFINDTPE